MGAQNSSALSAIKNGDIQSLLGLLLKTPGAYVDRIKFLSGIYNVSEDDIRSGNYYVSFSQRKLNSNKRIKANVRNSSGLSFVGGMPGGVAMAGTIPADIMQNMIYSIRLIQELAYIYDYENLADADDNLDSERMMLFLGIMFGAQGAASVLRVMSINTAKYTSQKIMNTALTKTIWYPIMKNISKVVASQTLTKKGLAGVASKSIPIIGGVASGGITAFSMSHEARRLNDEFIHGFGRDYGETDMEHDMKIIQAEYEDITDKDD